MIEFLTLLVKGYFVVSALTLVACIVLFWRLTR